MKSRFTCGLALVAALPLAACSGGGGSAPGPAPWPALDVGEVRELAGLSAQVETAEARQERNLDIHARADSLFLSTMHGEAGGAGGPAFRLLTRCDGTRCTVTEPVGGDTGTIALADTPLRQGAAVAIGAKRGITLWWESSTHTGADLGSLGAWLEHGSFAVLNEIGPGDEGPVDVWYGIALGELSGSPPAGSATWLGIMSGTPVAGDARGERLLGDAVLTYDLASGGDGSGASLDVAFGGIMNIDRGTAHAVGTVIFSDLEVGPDGTFMRGQSGTRIQGGFHGPDHAEAAGIFEHSGIAGAFGATRQQASAR